MRLPANSFVPLVMILAAPYTALADAFTATSVPADTRWVIHADVDAARATPLWAAARDRFYQPQQAVYLPRIQILERITGMKLPEELHDVTLFGAAYNENSLCIRIHGNMNADNTKRFLQTDPEFAEIPHRTFTILKWKEKERNRFMYAAFARPDLGFVAPSLSTIQSALDAVDGRAPVLNSSSSLASPIASAAGSSSPFIWAAAEGLSDLPRLNGPESPMITPLTSAAFSLEWSNNKLTSRMRATAKDNANAEQIRALVLGVKAFIWLQADQPAAPPELKTINNALGSLTIDQNGTTLTGEWSAPMETLQTLAEIVQTRPPLFPRRDLDKTTIPAAPEPSGPRTP